MFKILLLAVCFCVMGVTAFSQPGRNQIDSLKAVLKTSGEDTSAFNILASLSDRFGNRKLDSALHYARMALSLAVKLNNYKLQLKALYNFEFIYRFLNFNYQKAAETEFEALKIAESRNDTVAQANIWESLGAIYDDLDDPDQSIYYARKAYTLNKKIHNNVSALRCGEGIGYVYTVLHMPDSARPYFEEANAIGEQNPSDDRYVIFTLSMFGLGKVNFQSGKLNVALGYYKNSLAHSERLTDTWYAAINLMGLGELYRASGKNDSAIWYYKQALAKMDMPKLTPDIYRNLAELYEPANETISIKYWKLEALVRDSLYTSGKKIELQNMTFNELERQRSMADDQKKHEEQKAAALKLQRQQGLTYAGLAAVFMLLFFTFFITRSNKLLSKEKGLLSREKRKSEELLKRSDALLRNILPDDVATELKETGFSAAKQFDNVTVLFTDFVNFTLTGSRMSPQALVNELDACFKAFDEITGNYNIEKIKTIGDAYLAVAGLPIADPQHAEHIVRAAIEINTFMDYRFSKLGNNTFEIRIGIHTGCVVAGIVGVKKFAYDIWGDAVNTAARMEQNSEPGKINISQTTYELVKDKIQCEYRGEIEAKGKGMLKMYYVNG